MKRSRLKRRTPLARGGALRRRTPLRQRSAKRKAETALAWQVTEAAFRRDGRCLLAPHDNRGCFGGLTPHHLRKKSQGGEWSLDNIVTLCAFHNGWVEDQPFLAHALGLVVRNGETTADAWRRLARAGLVPDRSSS